MDNRKEQPMEINQIKTEMKSYIDFVGADLLGVDRVDECETKEELAQIIEEHSYHLEIVLSDAQSHLENFKKRIGLTMLDY